MIRVTITNGRVSRKIVVLDAPYPALGDKLRGPDYTWTVTKIAAVAEPVIKIQFPQGAK